MTVRFATWIEAQDLTEAWEKLRLALTDMNLGDKLERVFQPTVLEEKKNERTH